MIKINGTAIPTPSEFKITIKDSAAAERSASGMAIMDFSGSKRTLKLKWAHLYGEPLASLLQLVEGNFFAVEFPDPVTGGMATANFWCGGRTAGVLRVDEGIPVWTDIEMEWSEQ